MSFFWLIDKVPAILFHMLAAALVWFIYFVLFLCYQAFSAFFYIHSFLQRVTGITVSTPSELEVATKALCTMTYNEVIFFSLLFCLCLMYHMSLCIYVHGTICCFGINDLVSWNVFRFMKCIDVWYMNTYESSWTVIEMAILYIYCMHFNRVWFSGYRCWLLLQIRSLDCRTTVPPLCLLNFSYWEDTTSTRSHSRTFLFRRR